VDEAVEVYARRFPREWSFRLDVIPAVRRQRNDKSQKAKEAEGEQIIARLERAEFVVLLDERGRALDSKGLAAKLADWQRDGRDVCFIIGGPDGVSDRCRQVADFTWSLSQLTLPHGLARVLLAEQLYRAHALQTGHPYHRE
jgi:23S rRNA (pseudouridine1915-N3)-methyltransferase